MATLLMSDEMPAPPQDDFAFEIDFQKGVGPASRVFAATHQFIKACEALDAELVQSIDSSIETVLVLEDIPSKSCQKDLLVFLSNQLVSGFYENFVFLHLFYYSNEHYASQNYLYIFW